MSSRQDASSDDADRVAGYVRTRVDVEGIAVAEADLPDVCRRVIEARAAIERLWRYDLTGVDLAVQLSPRGQRP